jgi:hypothetical protein
MDNSFTRVLHAGSSNRFVLLHRRLPKPGKSDNRLRTLGFNRTARVPLAMDRHRAGSSPAAILRENNVLQFIDVQEPVGGRAQDGGSFRQRHFGSPPLSDLNH